MGTASLFKNGESQAVRLPEEFRFEGDRVYITRQGNGVLLLPYKEAWQSLFDSLDMFSPDFMEDRAQSMDVEEREPFD